MRKMKKTERIDYMIDTKDVRSYRGTEAEFINKLEEFYNRRYFDTPEYNPAERFRYYDKIQAAILTANDKDLKAIFDKRPNMVIISPQDMEDILQKEEKEEDKLEITFNDFEQWLEEIGYNLKWFAHMSLISHGKLTITTTDYDIIKRLREIKNEFNSGDSEYKKNVIDIEIVWGETPQRIDFWQTLYGSWRRRFDKLMNEKQSEEKFATEVIFDDLCTWLNKTQGISCDFFIEEVLRSFDSRTIPYAISVKRKVLENKFNTGIPYEKQKFFELSMAIGQTKKGSKFWKEIQKKWEAHFKNIEKSEKETQVDEKYTSSINLYKWLRQVSNKTIVRAFARSYVENGIIFPRRMYKIDEAIEILCDARIILENKQDRDLFNETAEKWRDLLEYYAKHEVKEFFIDWQIDKDLENYEKEIQKNTGEEMKAIPNLKDKLKEIDLLARAYYTSKGKRKNIAAQAIEEFFKKYMIIEGKEGSLLHIVGCPWTPQDKTFTGNIRYTSLVQKFFDGGLTPGEYLELIAMYRHEKFGAHTWIKPECKQAYIEYLNGGPEEITFWESNTKKIIFNAPEKEVVYIDKNKKKEYIYTFEMEELV